MILLTFWIPLIVLVLLYMAGWFGISRLTKRYDVVDSAWGLGFVYVAWISLLLAGNTSALSLISAGLVSVWGTRLFAHIANRNWRKHEDDRRYQQMRDKWGKLERGKALTNIFLLQGILLIIVSLPMIAIAMDASAHIHVLTVAGWIIWSAGLVFEAVADLQLSRFITRRTDPGQILDSGLWRFSRHPNYFGEVTTWWGAAIVALSIGQWWGVLGALTITVLITKISGIPPLEKHYAEDPKYYEYRKRTSVFVPLPPKHPNR